MFKELLDLSQELEKRPGFSPPGFYRYSPNTPIRWLVRIKPGTRPQARLQSIELSNQRPFSGRTSGYSDAYPLADEAGYVLGIGKAGDKKSAAFLELLEKMQIAPEITNQILRRAISSAMTVISEQLLRADPSFRAVDPKHWMAFTLDGGELADQLLFEHSEVRYFWFRHLREITSADKKSEEQIVGECSICGSERMLTGRVPGVKLGKPSPLLSENADAYVSRVEGSDAFKRSQLSVCLECGDAIARTLNYLANSTQHSRPLITDPQKNDSLDNYYALFWLRRAPIPDASTKPIADLSALLDAVPALMERAKQEPQQPIGPPPVLKQLEDLLKVPWSASEHTTALSEEGFYLLLLSPNKGRIAVRDWISVSLGTLRYNLAQFLDALRIAGPDGMEPRAFTIPMILDALRRPKSKLADADATRGLLRAAYLGEHPDWALLARALACFRSALRSLDDRSASGRELSPPLRFHICAAVLKLFCVFGKENASDMTTLEDQPAYLCGRLLAVLEEIQRRAAGKTKLNVTLVERLFSAAAMTPASTLSAAINRAQSGHLPKLRRDRRGYDHMQRLLQEISRVLVEQGGMPNTLAPVDQAKFALGYYAQRTEFNYSPTTDTLSTDQKEA